MMPSIMKQSRFKNILRRAAVALLWLAVWQRAAAAVGKELLIPYPRAVFLTLAELGKTAEFWRAVLLTMLRITAGYVSGSARYARYYRRDFAFSGIFSRPFCTLYAQFP